VKDLDKLWVGLVEDNKDPDRIGRVKVRVQSIYDDIPLDDIPWATPIKTLSARAFEVPAIGKMVSVFFPNDNLYEPYFMYADHYNVNVYNKIKNMSDDEYTMFVALLLDHRTQIFADDTNLTLDYQYNKITIDNENINLELKDAQQKLNIGCATSTQQAVLGTRYFEWMDKFMNELLKPSSLIGNQGSAVLKPTIEQLIFEYKQLRKDFVSDYVNIVDNRKIKKLSRTPKSSSQLHDGITINNGITTDETLKENILNQFQTANNSMKSATPSAVVDKKPVPVEDANGKIIEGISETPFGVDSNENITLYEQKGTETSFTNYDFKTSPNYVKVDVPVIENQTVKYVSESDAAQMKKKEQKDSGVINYGTDNNAEDTEQFVVEDQANPDDIISGMAFETDDTYVDSSNPDEITYDYDPNNIYVAPEGSTYVDKTQSSTTGSNNPPNYSSGQTKTGQKTKNVNGQIIKNGEVPEKYMITVKAANASGVYGTATAKLERHFAKHFGDLQAAYMQHFGKAIYITDSYRTYAQQVDVKNRKGRLAATPGTSLHGWGIAIDIGDSTVGGGISYDSAVYKWMDTEAKKYGKIINPSWARKGCKQAEPWHWEYTVGDSYTDI